MKNESEIKRAQEEMRFDEFMKSIARQGGSKIALRIGQDRIRR
jgi:hypothetical protein